MVDTADGTHLVYHRKVTDESGAGPTAEIRTTPVTWDAAGFPVAGPGLATGRRRQPPGLAAFPPSVILTTAAAICSRSTGRRRR